MNILIGINIEVLIQVLVDNNLFIFFDDLLIVLVDPV